MILYHGSNIIIDVIDLTKSKRYKDFDKFFLLSNMLFVRKRQLIN